MKLYVAFNYKGYPVGLFQSKSEAMQVHCSEYLRMPVAVTVQDEQDKYYCLAHEYYSRYGCEETMVKVLPSRAKLKAALIRYGYLNNGKMIADIPYYSSRCDDEGQVEFDKYVTDALLQRKTVKFDDNGNINLFRVQ